MVHQTGGKLCLSDRVSRLDSDAVLDNHPRRPEPQIVSADRAGFIGVALVHLSQGERVGLQYLLLAGMIVGRAGPRRPFQPVFDIGLRVVPVIIQLRALRLDQALQLGALLLGQEWKQCVQLGYRR